MTLARPSVRWLLVLAVFASASPGCGPEEGAGSRRTAAAITQGTVSQADPAVVALRPRRAFCGADPGGVLCTGALVGPRAVLTAAHCLRELAEQSASLEDLEIVFGPGLSGPVEVRRVVHAHPHPGYVAQTRVNDLALLLLDRAAAATPLALVQTEDAAALVGRTVRLVGFGMDGSGRGQGIRRTGTARISAVEDGVIRLAAEPSLSCGGDSGGPVLLEEAGRERVLAVIRSGDSACVQYSVATRVAPQLASFIQPWLETADGVHVDERRPVDPGQGFCAGPCAADADCPAGMLCLSEPEGPRCGYPQLRSGVFGSPCGSDAECGGGKCVGVGVGEAFTCRCFTRCADLPPTDPGKAGCSVGGTAPLAWALVAWGLLRRRGRARTGGRPPPLTA